MNVQNPVDTELNKKRNYRIQYVDIETGIVYTGKNNF